MAIGAFLGSSKGKKTHRGEVLQDLAGKTTSAKDVAAFGNPQSMKQTLKNAGSARKTIMGIQQVFANRKLSYNEATKLAQFLTMTKSQRKKSPLRVFWNNRLFDVSPEAEMYKKEDGSPVKAMREWNKDGKTMDEVGETVGGSAGVNAYGQDLGGSEAALDSSKWDLIQKTMTNEDGTVMEAFADKTKFQVDGVINDQLVSEAMASENGTNWANTVYEDGIGTASSDGGSSGGGNLTIPPQFYSTMEGLNAAVRGFGNQTITNIIQIDGNKIMEFVSANSSDKTT